MTKKIKKEADEFDVGEFLSSKFNSKKIELVSASDTETNIPYIIPFNHLGLQKASGGILGGKIASFEADSQSGKSFLMYEIIANAIKMGGSGFIVDAEQAYEPAYGEKCGIPNNTKKLVISNSLSIEDNFLAIRDYISWFRSKVPDIRVPFVAGLDSFVALRCNEQLENDAKNKDTGYEYKKKNESFYSELTKMLPILSETGSTLIILNQLRVDKSILFSDPHYSPGEMMKYFCTQRFKGLLSKTLTKVLEDDTKVKVGSTVNWEVIKNRRVEPFKKVSVQFMYRNGLLKYSGLPELLLREEEIVKIIKKDPEDARKKLKGFTVVGDESKKFYKLTDIKQALVDFPHLLEPKWTKYLPESETDNLNEDEEDADE